MLYNTHTKVFMNKHSFLDTNKHETKEKHKTNTQTALSKSSINAIPVNEQGLHI